MGRLLGIATIVAVLGWSATQAAPVRQIGRANDWAIDCSFDAASRSGACVYVADIAWGGETVKLVFDPLDKGVSLSANVVLETASITLDYGSAFQASCRGVRCKFDDVRLNAAISMSLKMVVQLTSPSRPALTATLDAKDLASAQLIAMDWLNDRLWPRYRPPPSISPPPLSPPLALAPPSAPPPGLLAPAPPRGPQVVGVFGPWAVICETPYPSCQVSTNVRIGSRSFFLFYLHTPNGPATTRGPGETAPADIDMRTDRGAALPLSCSTLGRCLFGGVDVDSRLEGAGTVTLRLRARGESLGEAVLTAVELQRAIDAARRWIQSNANVTLR